jgi:hypothetical protein
MSSSHEHVNSNRLNILIQRRIFSLDQISTFLSNHVHGILDPAIWNHWEDRCINDSEILDAVNLQLAVNHTFVNALGEAGSSTGIF